MTKDELATALKSNWYFVVALIAMVPAAILVSMKDDSKADARSLQTPSVAEIDRAQGIDYKGGVSFKSGESSRDGALKKIAEYDAYVAKNWTSDELPIYLRRIANLYYGPVQDYTKAIENYELILYRFPQWKGIDEIYPNLANAYKIKGQYAMERQTYRRMVKHYPSHSKYREFAQDKLTNFR